MTARLLTRWARLIRVATREGWPPAKLDAALREAGR